MIYKTDTGRYVTYNNGVVTEWPVSKALKIAERGEEEIVRCDDHNLAWADIHSFIKLLLSRIDRKNIKFITCPPGRGGLVPAAMLAYKLDVPFTPWEDAPNAKEGLWIDDIIDSGATLLQAVQQKPQLQRCALVSRWIEWDTCPVGRILKTPEYIVFPWDNGQ